MFEKLEAKIDAMIEDIGEIRSEQAVNKEIHKANSKSLVDHVKRTNKLQSNQTKIIYLLFIGAGIGIALYGPQFFKLIGIFL